MLFAELTGRKLKPPHVPGPPPPGGVVFVVTFAGSVLLFPKLFAEFSFGFVTVARFRKVPIAAVVVAGTVITGNCAPLAIAADVVQVMDRPFVVHVHPEPVGVPTKLTPAAGPGSVTVVTPVTGFVPLLVT
jgi:hypothetical protein